MCNRNGAKRTLGYTFHHFWLSVLLNSLSCMPVELPLPFTQITKNQMRPQTLAALPWISKIFKCQFLFHLSHVFPIFLQFWVICEWFTKNLQPWDAFSGTAGNKVYHQTWQAIRRAFKAISTSCRSKLCARANSSSFRRAPREERGTRTEDNFFKEPKESSK